MRLIGQSRRWCWGKFECEVRVERILEELAASRLTPHDRHLRPARGLRSHSAGAGAALRLLRGRMDEPVEAPLIGEGEDACGSRRGLVQEKGDEGHRRHWNNGRNTARKDKSEVTEENNRIRTVWGARQTSSSHLPAPVEAARQSRP